MDRFFHININCSDFERSLAFYELLGFRVILDFAARPGPARSFGEVGLGPVLRLPADCDGRAAFLALSDDRHNLRLDLIEWASPRVAAQPRQGLAQPGVARICLKARDADRLHGRLVEAGHHPYTPPTRIALGGSRFKVFCVEDPDGVVLEFMQFLGRDDQS